MTADNITALAAFALLNVAVASSGAFFRPGAWYEALKKPVWRPPNWLFGPAWTVLYTMIAIAGWLVWREAGWSGAGFALTVYVVHLAINASWSWLFFGLRRADIALGGIVILWLSIIATIALFRPISETAAWLLAPYLAWVSFAGALNFSIWRLNRTAQRTGAR
jgi:tryptophan-rich sensory protein